MGERRQRGCAEALQSGRFVCSDHGSLLPPAAYPVGNLRGARKGPGGGKVQKEAWGCLLSLLKNQHSSGTAVLEEG